MEAIILGAAPFVLNAVVGAAIWLMGTNTLSNSSKRGILAFFAVIGAIAQSHLSGTPLDVGSTTSLIGITLMAAWDFVIAHATYVAFWKPAK